MLNIRELERRVADGRDEVDRAVRQGSIIKQMEAGEDCVHDFRLERRLRCQLGLALVRLGTRLAA